MPALEYDPSVPIDSRWRWITRVPAAWLALRPDYQVDRALKLIALRGGTDNGNPPSVSVRSIDGVAYFFINWDIDPDPIFDGVLPTLDPTPRERALNVLGQFRTRAAPGSTNPPTLRETQFAILALMELLDPRD